MVLGEETSVVGTACCISDDCLIAEMDDSRFTGRRYPDTYGAVVCQTPTVSIPVFVEGYGVIMPTDDFVNSCLIGCQTAHERW